MKTIKARVHRLPTEDSGTSSMVIQKCIKELSDVKVGELKHTPRMMHSKEYFQEQHLYFTTDEKIKEGDWFYNGMNKIVVKATNRYSEMKNPIPHRKIIATTDPKLKLLNEEGLKGMNELHVLSTYSKAPKSWYNYLPQPSQAFIEKWIKEYNKGNIISEVMVDYEEY
jgi:hypothetical protein